MKWVYLSPHFDDVVLSCGGRVYDQIQSGQPVEIWTICAGIPAGDDFPISPFARSLHERWQTGSESVLIRRQEDEAAVQVLGASTRYWSLPDCIYRRLVDGTFLVNGEEDLWQPVNPQESGVIERLSQWIQEELAPGDHLVSPMTLGNHVDHRLVRAAAEHTGWQVHYYGDYPYSAYHPEDLSSLIRAEWRQICSPISSDGLDAWQRATARYTSQISTFWNGLEAMRQAIEYYWRGGGGSCLWV